MYDNGHGTKENPELAAKWYLKAAKNGSAIAQNNIGLWYERGVDIEQDRTQALRWFRAAADQGNESAAKNLARLEAFMTQVLTPQAMEVEVPSANQRIKKRSRKPNTERCKPLLDASTPSVYRRNAFRITGLPVDATPRQFKRRLGDLKDAEEMGDAEEEHTHAFALNPPPSMEHIREAEQRLHDPERRMIEEFFWFWPKEWGSSKKDHALSALLNGDKDTAFEAWTADMSDHNSQDSIVARHNLAVMYQLVALDSEHYALDEDLEQDQYMTITKYWRTCFKWWEELTEDETFWSLVTGRIRMLDDPRLTTGFARRMRATLPEAMDKINAMMAIDFIDRGKDLLAEQHIDYMLETHQGQDDVAGTMALVASPLLTRIRAAVDRADKVSTSSPSSADSAASNMIQVVGDPLRILRKFLPPDDYQLVDICDAVAGVCLKCQRSYVRATDDTAGGMAILEAFQGIAASPDTKKEVADALRIARQNVAFAKHGEPISERLKEIDELPSHTRKLDQVRGEIIPQIEELHRHERSSTYEMCADIVAGFLRGLSVSAFNEDGDLSTANRALQLAIGLACDSALIEQLEEDKKQLGNLDKQAHAHDLSREIRSTAVVITQEGIQYKNQSIEAKDLYGLRFGVFVQYTNGAKSNWSYRIDYRARNGRTIIIECKRAFRSEAKVKEDFNAILDATLHQLAPGLVARVAEEIVGGRSYDMGSGCSLTPKGVTFSTGALMWKTEHVIPYSEVRCVSSQGSLILSSSRDKKAQVKLSLREAWNAVLFEHIAKAILAG